MTRNSEGVASSLNEMHVPRVAKANPGLELANAFSVVLVQCYSSLSTLVAASALLTALLQQFGDQPRPASLVTGTYGTLPSSTNNAKRQFGSV